MNEIDSTVEQIERLVNEQCVKELPSGQVGEYVMEALKKLDKIAYVRFASVYREFSDLSQFVDTLQGLLKKGNEKKNNRSSRSANN